MAKFKFLLLVRLKVNNNDKLNDFTHINHKGEAHMVDVGNKTPTKRSASAIGYVRVSAKTLAMILNGEHHKGDVFATARIAGIMAAKNTANMIPLCHPLALTKIELNLTADASQNLIIIESLCALDGKTGVEMEALTAVSVAALTIYDMCKAVQKDIQIENIHLVEKTGGKSGNFIFTK